MDSISYNDQQNQMAEMRHLFIPGRFALISEAIVGIVALVLINLSTLSQVLGSSNAGITTNPLSLWGNVINRLVGNTQRYMTVQEILLFLLWALAGALIYVLAFRFVQISLRAKNSVRDGVVLIQAEHSRGALRYFASLHDFLVKLIIAVLGIVAILTGTLLCFAIASQQLSDGFVNEFPSNVGNFALAFVGAFIGVRVITVGISLLSPRFRAWYNI